MNNTKDELIINGKRYVHTPEENKDRLQYMARVEIETKKIISSEVLPTGGSGLYLEYQPHRYDLIKLVEIKMDEIIVSKSMVQKALDETVIYGEISETSFMKELGFK